MLRTVATSWEEGSGVVAAMNGQPWQDLSGVDAYQSKANFMLEAPRVAAIIRPGTELTPVHQARVRELFEGALALCGSDRERWLGEACAGETDVYSAVLDLLIAHERVEDGLTLSPHIA